MHDGTTSPSQPQGDLVRTEGVPATAETTSPLTRPSTPVDERAAASPSTPLVSAQGVPVAAVILSPTFLHTTTPATDSATPSGNGLLSSSIRNKIGQLEVILNINNIDVLCINEHWLYEDEITLYVPEGFIVASSFSRKPPLSRGGSSIMVLASLNKGVSPPAYFDLRGWFRAGLPFFWGDMTLRLEAVPSLNLTHLEYPVTPEAVQRSLYD
ncbi:hypothetical protein J6590_104950 [Homalodisca vitripennis]|nr:hypothetical protein J6590_104950 [Homalodisca vitripennis]